MKETVRITKRWSVRLADYEYVLEALEHSVDGEQKPVSYWNEFGRGDKVWAEKNAKHFGVKVIEPQNG